MVSSAMTGPDPRQLFAGSPALSGNFLKYSGPIRVEISHC